MFTGAPVVIIGPMPEPPSAFDAVAAQLAAPPISRSEADIQSDIKALLLAGEFLPGHTPGLEVSVEGGRIDIEYANLLIECKRDVGSAGSRARHDHEQQLKGYLASRERTGARLLCGLLTDGRTWLQYRLSAIARSSCAPKQYCRLPVRERERSGNGWARCSPPTAPYAPTRRRRWPAWVPAARPTAWPAPL